MPTGNVAFLYSVKWGFIRGQFPSLRKALYIISLHWAGFITPVQTFNKINITRRLLKEGESCSLYVSAAVDLQLWYSCNAVKSRVCQRKLSLWWFNRCHCRLHPWRHRDKTSKITQGFWSDGLGPFRVLECVLRIVYCCFCHWNQFIEKMGWGSPVLFLVLQVLTLCHGSWQTKLWQTALNNVNHIFRMTLRQALCVGRRSWRVMCVWIRHQRPWYICVIWVRRILDMLGWSLLLGRALPYYSIKALLLSPHLYDSEQQQDFLIRFLIF